MKVTITFANPFLVIIYTVAMLMIGWAIGAHWGHTLTAGWLLFVATIFLFLHDACIAILLAMAATRVVASGKRPEVGRTRATAEPSNRRTDPTAMPVTFRNPSESGEHQGCRKPYEYLDLDIEELEFSVRTYNHLKTSDIQTVRTLIQCSEDDLTDAGFDPVAINEIKETLDAIGFQLEQDYE